MTKEDEIEVLNMLLDIVSEARWSHTSRGDYHAANALDAFWDAIYKYRTKAFNDTLKGGD